MTTYPPGTRCAIDIADYTELELGYHSKALHAVDVGPGKPSTVLFNSVSNLVDHIRFIRRQYMKAEHTLQTVVIDAQFVTEDITRYLETNRIEVQQPSP